MSRMQGFALPADVTSVIASARARTAALRAKTGAEDSRWYRITNAAGDEAELLLYDEIGGIFGTYAEDFDAELKAITAPKLTVRVNSPGGSVTEGIAIASALRAHPAEITVRVDGIAASIASVIAMAGDRVAMMPGSMIMVHEAAGLCLGDSRDMIKMGQVLDVISENIAEMYAAKSGAPADEWRAKMLDETWLRAEEAVEQGLADEVVQPKKPQQDGEEPEMHKAFDLAAYGYTGPKQPEPPKPTPPAQTPAPAASEQTLTINIGATLDEAFVEQLRAMVRARKTPAPVEDTASGVHHTATENSAWDGPGAVSAMPNDKATLRYCHAWHDPDGDPDAKSSYKFPHHRKDGGPANLAACRNGLARLSSADIPEAEREGVRKHLQAHLDDAHSADGNQADVEPTAHVEPEEPVSEWAAAFAHLIKPKPDPWAEAFAHLVNPQPSSSAATAAA